MASSVTSAYQQTLAAALQSISPNLAALHNARLKERDTATATLTCVRCGTFLVPGQGSIRLQRKTRRSRTRRTASTSTPAPARIRIDCHVCGLTDFRPLPGSGEGRAVFEPARTVGRRRSAAIAISGDVRAVADVASSAVSSREASSTPSTPLARGIQPDQEPGSTALTPHPPPHSRSPSVQVPPTSTHSPHSLPTTPITSPSPAPSSSTTNTATPKTSAARKKKKSSLQEMLERNRLEKRKKLEERERGGLLGFLDGF